MAIDFSVEPEFQEKLDWMDTFVTTEIEPIDLYFRGEVNPFDRTNETANALIDRSRSRCRTRVCGPATWVPISAGSATARSSWP